MRERLKIVVFTQSGDLFGVLRSNLPGNLTELQLLSESGGAVAPGTALAFVDARWGSLTGRLLEQLGSQGVHRVLIEDERAGGGAIPQLLLRGLVDDVLLTPVRPLEIMSKMRHAAHLESVKDLVSVNADLGALIRKFDEDLRTARNVQGSLIPEKFAAVQGLKVAHKYLSGLKSGGDYLDFFEFSDGNHVGILMSDSTGYGLSSALMSVILKMAVRLSKDGRHSPSETIAHIFEELRVAMKPKESLSLFYGIFNRKTFDVTYASCGTIQLVHQRGKRIEPVLAASEPLTKDGNSASLADKKLHLEPEDRVVIYSDGFGNAIGAGGEREQVFGKCYGDEAVALINELTYRIKSKFEDVDDMPEQDCSVMILDIEKRAMRLAR